VILVYFENSFPAIQLYIIARTYTHTITCVTHSVTLYVSWY